MNCLYPQLVCYDCGYKAQNIKDKIYKTSIYNVARCDVCNEEKATTTTDTFSNPNFKVRVTGNE